MSSRCTSRSAEAASSGTNDGGVVVVCCPLLRRPPSRRVACSPRCPCSASSLSGKTNLCSKIRVTQVHHGRTCDGCTWGEPLGQWTWCARAVVRVRCRSRVLTCCSRLPCWRCLCPPLHGSVRAVQPRALLHRLMVAFVCVVACISQGAGFMPDGTSRFSCRGEVSGQANKPRGRHLPPCRLDWSR